MKIRRSRFLTFIFAMLPGAGHMFMGFMKRGVSLMTAFFAFGVVSNWIHIGVLSWVAPIVWFYAFFDCINLAWASDEVFNEQEDDYFFGTEFFTGIKKAVMGKYRAAAGVGLVLVGIYMLIENIAMRIDYQPWTEIMNNVFSFIPQLAVAGLIIFAGIRLIIGKKEEMDDDE